ncbi:MAG: hypothetical protein F6K16_28165 [Symploca sp. SIO2B6]|nr:hypothetical protein [Symploca sp. SIO2B6]
MPTLKKRYFFIPILLFPIPLHQKLSFFSSIEGLSWIRRSHTGTAPRAIAEALPFTALQAS